MKNQKEYKKIETAENKRIIGLKANIKRNERKIA